MVREPDATAGVEPDAVKCVDHFPELGLSGVFCDEGRNC
jgi:hypothetical protein